MQANQQEHAMAVCRAREQLQVSHRGEGPLCPGPHQMGHGGLAEPRTSCVQCTHSTLHGRTQGGRAVVVVGSREQGARDA